MENTMLWDWNSNDADVCCITKDAASIYSTNNSFVIWGADTQGGTPEPPNTKANHCCNIVATSAMSLPDYSSTSLIRKCIKEDNDRLAVLAPADCSLTTVDEANNRMSLHFGSNCIL